MLTAVMIDSREPEWVQQLQFGGCTPMVAMLDEGDALLVCDDDRMLCVERKTPDDLLSSIADGRLLNQAGALTNKTTWAYLVVTGELQRSHDGHVITPRGATGWNWNSVQGALLTVQEMGVFVLFCGGDHDYERCLLGLAQRSRESVPLWPARPPKVLSVGETVLASLPGIGLERLKALLSVTGTAAHALVYLTGEYPATRVDGIGEQTRRSVRKALGLGDNESLFVATDNQPVFNDRRG